MKNFCRAWNVNVLAQAAGLAVLQSDSPILDTLAKLEARRTGWLQGWKN